MLRNRWIKALVFVVCAAPLAWLGWRAWHENLTANPIEYITHFTGDWTIRFLVLTLAVTPLRRLFQLPDLIRFRRMFALYAFTYGSLHFLTWFWLDKGIDLREIALDVAKRRFVTVGFAALLLMVPLALTSTGGWVRRLGVRRWQRLHRLVYFSAMCGVVHYYWLVKSDVRLPVFYASITAVLLAARMIGRSKAAPAPGASPLLRVSNVKRETHDTVTLQFPLPPGKFKGAKPGQFLTFDWVVDGKKLPRSYSISSSPLRSDYVEITVKQQGIVSTFLNCEAKKGLTVDARAPFGLFCFDDSRDRDIVLFAGGSGITPIMSMLRYIEEVAADTEILLFYSVRSERDVIFQEDLDRLRQRLPRFRCVVVASRPGAEWRGPRGRLDRALIEGQLGPVGQRTFFLCGPDAFMASVKGILMTLGVSAGQIRQERFTVRAAGSTGSVEFARSGGKYETPSTETLLETAERHGIDIPYSCRAGQCGTCATRVLEGDVVMEADEGLDPALRAQGYRLMCVGHADGPVKLEA